jgi:hypothetical protein
MKPARWLTAVLALTIVTAELQAQGIANSNPSVRGNGITLGSSRFVRSRSIIITAYPSGLYGLGYGYPLSASPLGVGQVTVLQPYVPRTTVIIVVPHGDSALSERLTDNRPPNDIIRIRPRRKAETEPEPEPKPREPRKPEPELIQPPKPVAPPKPPPKLPEPPRVIPEPTPAAESARHLALGKEAFVAGEYGRAAFRFRKAALVAPDQALPHFLVAQALLALGKYRDAVDAIRAGMALDPTWPTSGVRPRDLYGEFVADYAEHLQQLGAALAQHPDDPVLLFLSAYFMWFDGRKIEARPLFEKAAPLVPDRAIIDQFLKVMPE